MLLEALLDIITKICSFPGKLFSVRPSIASWLQGLFCVNERALYVGKWKYGFFSCTPVGALNVGSINVGFDKVSNWSVFSGF